MCFWSSLTIPYIADEGDIIMAPQGSKNFPALLSIREVGDRFETAVVSQESAAGRAVNSIYGMESRRGE